MQSHNMSLTISLLLSVILLDYFDCNAISAKVGNSGAVKSFGTSGLKTNGIFRNLNDARFAVLAEPASRAYNSMLNSHSGAAASDISVEITKPSDFLVEEHQDGKTIRYVASEQHSSKHENVSHLKTRLYNESHLATEITWQVDDPLLVERVEVFLSNSTSYVNGEWIKGSPLNLVCLSGERNLRWDIDGLRFDCYIRDEFIEDLLYNSGGFGVLLSALKLFGRDDPIYQVADVSLHKIFKQTTGFHGYVIDPPSRAKLCSERINQKCGLIVYEPQSVEGFQGFPDHPKSPPDGRIASGNNDRFKPLDEYGTDRWNRVEFPSVSSYNETHVNFTIYWYLTAPHSTKDIRVYVNNGNFSSNEPLSRRHLDLEPICMKTFGGQIPVREVTLECLMSKEKLVELSQHKEGLLLSVWNIHDTSFAFYQVIDIAFST